MRKIYLMCISLVMLMAACQKEAANVSKQANSNVSSGLNANTTGNKMWSLPKGFEANSYYNNGGQMTLQSVASLGDASLYCGGIHTAELHAGNQILGGQVQWANDAVNLYITFFAYPDWYFTDVQLYVGRLSSMPHVRDGSPSQGRFPYQRCYSYNNLQQHVDFTIPLANLTKDAAGNWIIAAAANIVKTQLRGNKHTCQHRDWYDDDDDDDASNDNNLEIVAQHSVWGQGIAFFNQNNGCGGQNIIYQTYIPGTLGTCGGGGGVGDIKANNSNKN